MLGSAYLKDLDDQKAGSGLGFDRSKVLFSVTSVDHQSGLE